MRDNLGYGADAEWARARARDAAEKPSAKSLFGRMPDWLIDTVKTTKPAPSAAAASTPVQKPVQGPAVPFAASSSGVHAALKQQGWKTPPPAKAVRSPEDVFKLNETKDLASFSYVVEPEEWSRITKSFEGRPGYTSPTAQAAQVNPFKPVEGSGIMPAAPTWAITSPSAPTTAMAAVKALQPQVTEETQSAALTWDDYQKLSQDQRAAVDFNTLLVNAREQDLNRSYAPKPEAKTAYDKQVLEMFGEKGGSDTYAPQTVALLQQIDFKGVGQDLDEYLSLERAVDTAELKDFKFTDQLPISLAAPVSAQSPENVAVIEAATVQKSEAKLQKVMQDANAVLADFTTSMYTDRYSLISSFGGQTAAPEMTAGFPIAADTVAQLDDWGKFKWGAYDSLARGDMQSVWDEVAATGLDDAQTQELFQYFDTRSQQELRFGRPAPYGDGSNSYLAPEEIRSLAGLGG